MDGRVTAGHQCIQVKDNQQLGEGGELVVEDTCGMHSVKLPCRSHGAISGDKFDHVRPVTRSARIASVFWIQSMLRDDAERTLLFDLDTAIQRVNCEPPASQSVVQLSGICRNLVRRWAEA